MANEKLLNVRVALKIDTLTNWNASSLPLKKGEIAIATTAAADGIGLSEPVCLIKIGEDGVKTFKELPYSLHAKSSDVLAACKTETGLKTFINNVIAEAGIASDEAMQELAGRVTAVEGGVEALEGLVGEKAVATQIEEAIAALKLDETYVKVGALDDSIAAAKKAGDDAQKDVDALELKVGIVPEGKDVITLISDEKSRAEGIEGGLRTDVDAIKGDYLKVADKTELEGKITAEKERAEGIEGGLRTDVDTIKGDYLKAADKTELSGLITAEKERAEGIENGLRTDVDKKVASVTAGDLSVTVGGTSTAPTVAVKLSADADNALKLEDDGLKVTVGAAPEYIIEKASDSGDYAAVYNLKKDGAIVGASINIPKDMVVSEGSVVENPEGQPAGTYIKLVLQNVENPLYINVGNLIEYVTSGSIAGDMVVINVSDDHKVTATITDGTITLAKLHTDVQTAIGKAHSHENADVLVGITADKVEAWDKAEGNAKSYADGLNTTMDGRVKVLEGIDHDAYIGADTALKTELEGKINAIDNHSHDNKELLDTYTQTEANLADAVAKKHEHANADELAKIVNGDVAKWNSSEQNAKDYADGLIEALGIGDYVKKADADTYYAAIDHNHDEDYDAKGSAKTVQDNLDAYITSNNAEVVKKANDAELATVAKSGLIDDLSIGEGTTLVFSCGDSVK